MKRTTIYLPDDRKRRLEVAARLEQRTEADIIREALDSALSRRSNRPPQVPLFEPTGTQTDWAERVDELLEGFGGSRASRL